MMSQRNLGFSPLELAVGSGALVTGVFYYDNYTLKESIKKGTFVATGVYAVYRIFQMQ
jgi:hypothetical protein